MVDIEAIYKRCEERADRLNRDGWDQAEDFHTLNKAGETQKAIAQRMGLAEITVRNYIKTWKTHGSSDTRGSFGDAFTLVKDFANDPDGAEAVQAMKEVGLVKSLTRANIDHQADIRTIAAEIANLPDDQKRDVARELAHDLIVRQEVRAEDYKEREDQLRRLVRERPERPDPLTVAAIRVALWKLEKTVHEALDGRTKFTDDERAMLNLNANRGQIVVDLMRMAAEGAPDDNAWADFEESLAGGLNG